MTATWNELPDAVRVAVQHHIGTVTHAVDIHDGQNNDIAVVLRRAEGPPMFLKGVHGVSLPMRFLRNEASTARLTNGLAPNVLFAEDVDGWLIVGFDYCPGRSAVFRPKSPDLPLIASTVEKISALPAPGVRPLRDRWHVDWWERLADSGSRLIAGWDTSEAQRRAVIAPELAHGDRLTHTDLHPDQFIIDAHGRVHVIDWGFPAAAAPWVDTAFLILRLIDAGHPPLRAEEWARSLPCFAGVDAKTLTAFTLYVAGMWTYWAHHEPDPGKQHRAKLALTYADWRINIGW